MRDIRAYDGGPVPDKVQATARALLEDELLLRQRANGLYADAATFIVKSLGKSQQAHRGADHRSGRENPQDRPDRRRDRPGRRPAAPGGRGRHRPGRGRSSRRSTRSTRSSRPSRPTASRRPAPAEEGLTHRHRCSACAHGLRARIALHWSHTSSCGECAMNGLRLFPARGAAACSRRTCRASHSLHARHLPHDCHASPRRRSAGAVARRARGARWRR